MATKLDIWKRALNKIGELPVTSLTESSVNQRLLSANYDDDLKAVLEMHSWKFARVLVQLAATTAPAFGYDVAYQLPTDFVKIVYLNNTDPEYRERFSFDIVGDQLHTNETTAKIVYISNATGEGRFSPGFVDALATYIGRNIAYTRTKSQPLMERMDAMFDKALARAKRSDSANDVVPRAADSSFPNIAARRNGTTTFRIITA